MELIIMILFTLLFIYLLRFNQYIQYKDENKIAINKFYTRVDELKQDYITNQDKEQLISEYKEIYEKTKNYGFIYHKFNNNFKNIESLIERYNEEYIEKELKDKKEYFDNLFKYKIDEQQRKAIITDDNNNLIIAGAGSGKTTTMIGKVKYLTEKKNVKPEEILTISFTNNAVNNFKNKLNNDLVKCTTFHKLGLDILNNNETKKDITESLLDDVINKYLKKDIYNDEEKLKTFIEFCSLYMHVPVDINENLMGEIIDHEVGYDLETIKSKYLNYESICKNGDLSTLNHEKVKSYEEYMIANYLYLNGVSYKYEEKYKYNTATSEFGQYHPDFYLDEYDIYLEHFGINKEGRAPQYNEFEEKRYIDSMNEKRLIHKQNGTKLIETYSYNTKEGTLFTRIDEQLKKYNVKYKPVDYKLVANAILKKESIELNSFISLVSKFIKIFKGNNYEEDKLDIFIGDSYANNNYRNVLILSIIKDIYVLYQKKLKENKQIDFNDMINLATNKIKNGHYQEKISYIIIDEFQDISYSRYCLIKSLQDINNCKIIAVGDDWQSIYRFSGCDLDLFVNFKNYFSNPKIMFIENTYRNSQQLINISSEFIMKNVNGQIRKNIKSNLSLERPISIYFFKYNLMLATRKAVEELKNSGCKNIAILGRNNSDIKKYINTNKINKEYDLSKLFNFPVVFTTIHKSKGLEYDGVIVCNMENSIKGFPNKMSDDSVIDYVALTKDNYLFEEERRLFYVALTRTKSKCILLTSVNKTSTFINELYNKDVNIEIVEDDVKLDNPSCPICQTGILIMRENHKKNSLFVGCSNYPKCNFTNNSIDIINNTIKCPDCGSYLVKRKGPFSYFYGCINYPRCKHIRKLKNK